MVRLASTVAQKYIRCFPFPYDTLHLEDWGATKFISSAVDYEAIQERVLIVRNGEVPGDVNNTVA